MTVSIATTAPEHTTATASSQRRQLRSGLLGAAALSVLVGGLVLAIPGLGAVGHRVAHAGWDWLVLAGALELASCLGYVLAFQGIFNEIPARFGALVATAEQAFGAVVPVGGAGGIAAGGWLLARAGMPIRVIAERSAVLFLITSATNVVALVLAGAGLASGISAGPHDLALSALPASVGVGVLVLFLALARRASSHGEDGASLASRALRATAAASAATLRAIQRPGWRLPIGALAFLLCDIAVLWLAIHALGYDVPVAPLLLAYLIGYLANAIPIPGGVGVLDGGLAAALVLYHVPAPVALGGVLIYHALALWIPALSGTVGFIAAHRQINAGDAELDGAQPIGSGTPRPSTGGESRRRRADRDRRSSPAVQPAGTPAHAWAGSRVIQPGGTPGSCGEVALLRTVRASRLSGIRDLLGIDADADPGAGRQSQPGPRRSARPGSSARQSNAATKAAL